MIIFKTSLLFILLGFASFCQAQITGTLVPLRNSEWILENNTGTKIKVKGDSDGKFMIDLKNLEKGMYSFGEIEAIYLEPDYKINIGLKDQHYAFTGNGSKENNLIQKMRLPLNKLIGNSGYYVNNTSLLTEPVLFIPKLDAYKKNVEVLSRQSDNAFFKQIVTMDAEFDKLFCLYAYNRFYGLDSSKTDNLRKVLAIPVQERTPDHRQKLMAAYEKQFSKKLSPEEKVNLNTIIYQNWDMNNELMYKQSKHYGELIGYRIDDLVNRPEYKNLKDSIKNNEKLKLILVEQLITNPAINQYFTYKYTVSAIKSAKNPADVEQLYLSFLTRVKNQDYKMQADKAFSNLGATLINAQAPDFDYINQQGKMVSLKSLRGKYVYIDVWATWCAPCIAEIPSLKKMEEKFKNKNIKFVSISVDVAQHKQAWLDFVQKNNLQGIQLMADQDFKSVFIQKFAINSIPRFILIGPDGKIIDNNAKRPSDEQLLDQLESLKL